MEAASMALLLAFASGTPLSSFLPPQIGIYATGGELGLASLVTSPGECASQCLSRSDCISFNLDTPIPHQDYTCGIKEECWSSNASSCPSLLTFRCYGGTFTSVKFASYGTPISKGGCSFGLGSCHANNSQQVVEDSCLGKSRCAIPAGGSTFGNVDPCQGVVKFVAVSLDGKCIAPTPNTTWCQLNGYARDYNLVKSSEPDFYYQRLQPRNDAPVKQAVPYRLTVPTSNVTIHDGVLLQAFNAGIQYLIEQFTVDDLLWRFRQRAGIIDPPGQCTGWDCRDDWVEGSLAGLFLMGAGGHLRWVEHPQLRSMMDQLIDGIENCTEGDGYLAAFAQSKLATDEHPDYTTSWTVHGFLEAAIAGNPKALRMIREHMNVFNNHTLLPTFLPPDGGNYPYQVPIGPWPPGADNKTATGSGTLTGHTIYLIDQGLIHQTRMALSPVGTQADVDLVASIYQEKWWLQMLSEQNLAAIWAKVWFPHNYKITAFEAYADMYVLTGEQLYLDAVLGAWKMLRDPQRGWILHGGSLAINEGDYYAPGSFHLDYSQPEPGSGDREARKRDWFREDRERHAHGHSHHHDHHHHHDNDDDEDNVQWGNQFPTGEFCGAMFWLKLNQRFHRLWPDNETFVAEIEREIYNEALNHQGPIVDGKSTGIRYFSVQNGLKTEPDHIGTCCEGQGSRLYGSLNEYLFSLSDEGVYVDIYAPATITFLFRGSFVNITVETNFPYGNDYGIIVSSSPHAVFDLALRIPTWTTQSSITVFVDKAPNKGTPGEYLHLQRGWNYAVLNFSLPVAPVAHLYTGVTQKAPFVRYAYTVGPILMAATSESLWNQTLKSLVIPGIDGSVTSWMISAGDGNPLHFSVKGFPDLLFVPQWEIKSSTVHFTSYPCFQK